MNYHTPERADALAARYVLGTMSPRARARFAKLARVDRGIGDAVRAWEERLLPLAESVPPVAPPVRVWQRILSRIQSGRAPVGAPESIWANVGLWRGLTLAGFATALALVVVLFTPPAERPDQTMVVVLAGQDAKPALIASADRGGRSLLVKAVTPVELPADRALELWALPAQGNPRSLGLIAPSGLVRISLPGPADIALANIPALAVSLEPKGGSPTGLPTGAVLYTGTVQRLY
jgi:anti-sigma-K factor RskA